MTQHVTDTIAAETRQNGNKGAARRLRRVGKVPAVAYGARKESDGTVATRFLALDPKTFLMQCRQYGLSHIYDVTVADGPTFKALIKEVQRDAVSRELLHVDLYAVDLKRPIRVVVPIELSGKPAGLIEGGLLSQVLRSAEVQCLPTQIPVKIAADVSPLKVGDSLHMSDLKLPEGVRFTSHGDQAIALVTEPEEVPAAPTAAEAAAAGPAAGTAAAPAKPGDKK